MSCSPYVCYWSSLFSDSLFSASASDQRKYWGFVLFQCAISNVPAALIPCIFSKNFLRCFTNQLASSDRYLHPSAKKAVKSINARIENEPCVAVKVLACLLKPPNGRINFDQVTKTKTVEKLLAQVDDHDLSDLLQMYSVFILKPNAQNEKAAAVDRQIAADHLLNIARSRQALADADPARPSEPTLFVRHVLALLAKHTYFDQRQGTTPPSMLCSPPIAETTRSVFRSRIASCLIHILAKSAQPAGFVYELIDNIRSQEESEDGRLLTLEHDESVSKSINKGWVILQKTHSKAVSTQGPKKRLLGAFELLYALALLQVYNGDADAVNMLDDLKDCYDNLIKHKSRSHQAGSDGLVEILLSFVAKPSSLFRRLASQVFSRCTNDISESGLQSMIKVRDPCRSVRAQQHELTISRFSRQQRASLVRKSSLTKKTLTTGKVLHQMMKSMKMVLWTKEQTLQMINPTNLWVVTRTLMTIPTLQQRKLPCSRRSLLLNLGQDQRWMT